MGAFIMTGRSASLTALFQKGGAALARWTSAGAARWLPAVVFFGIALAALFFYRKRGAKIWIAALLLFTALGVLQAAGLLNTAALLSRWLLFTGG
jgi:hypothetical protein